MRNIILSAPVVTAALIAAVVSGPRPATAQDARATTVMPEIVIEGRSLPPTRTIVLQPGRTDVAPTSDGGSYLRSLPGVDGVKMGAHGVDPVIRGQQQDQLNIVSDGAFVYGGCPNRMDPPAALSSIDSYDKITVEKGYQSVRHGAGGSGGTIILERVAPSVTEADPLTGRVSAGGDSNGKGFGASVDIAHKVLDGYVRGQATTSRAGVYRDGKGAGVRSGFDQWSAGLETGWTPNDLTEASIGVERDEVNNTLFAGAGMDSPYGLTETARMKVRQGFDGGPIGEVRANAYGTWVDHLMDNYSLRGVGAMAMRTPSRSDTYGAKIESDVRAGDIPVVLGMDFKFRRRDAERYRGMTTANVNTLNSWVWPGLEDRQIGVFGEGTLAVAAETDLKLGLRYDNVNVTADRVGLPASPSGTTQRTPNALYAMYYGKEFQSVTENNVGGLARLDRRLGEDTTVHAGLSRTVRTADSNERAIASDSGTASGRWVGRPDIAPEQHHALDVGVDTKAMGWSVSATAYYDRVSDFILRDTARGQSGILLTDYATIYRNVDAALAGSEVAVEQRFGDIGVSANAAYTWGQNGDTNKPLAQIPPLKFGMDVTYDRLDWTWGGRLNAAATQDRVDSNTATGSGLDVGQTSGYATMDLYGTTAVTDAVDLGLGVNNVFDATYANHLNKSNAFDTTQVQVNEPGRSLYLKVTGRF